MKHKIRQKITRVCDGGYGQGKHWYNVHLECGHVVVRHHHKVAMQDTCDCEKCKAEIIKNQSKNNL